MSRKKKTAIERIDKIISKVVRYRRKEKLLEVRLMTKNSAEYKQDCSASWLLLDRLHRTVGIDPDYRAILGIVIAHSSESGAKGKWIAPGKREEYGPWTSRIAKSMLLQLGICEKTLYEKLNVLEANGFFYRSSHKAKDGKDTINVFRLTNKLFYLLNVKPQKGVNIPAGFDTADRLREALGLPKGKENKEGEEGAGEAGKVQNGKNDCSVPVQNGKRKPHSNKTISNKTNNNNDNLSALNYEVVHWIREVITSHQPHAVSSSNESASECGCSNQLGIIAKHGFVMSATPSSCDIKSPSALANANILVKQKRTQEEYTAEELAALEELDMLE